MSLVWIPNILSLGNLFFGFTAMLAALRGRFDLAIMFIFISMVLDMFDGRVARMIKRENPDRQGSGFLCRYALFRSCSRGYFLCRFSRSGSPGGVSGRF